MMSYSHSIQLLTDAEHTPVLAHHVMPISSRDPCPQAHDHRAADSARLPILYPCTEGMLAHLSTRSPGNMMSFITAVDPNEKDIPTADACVAAMHLYSHVPCPFLTACLSSVGTQALREVGHISLRRVCAPRVDKLTI